MNRIVIILAFAGCVLVPVSTGYADARTVSTVAGLVAAAPRLEPGDVLIIAAGVYTESFELKGLSGEAERPVVIAGEEGKRVLFDLDHAEGIRLEGCSFVTLRGIEIAGAAKGCGLTLTDCNECLVEGNSVHDGQLTGIHLVSSDNNTVRGNVAYHNDSGIYVGDGSTRNLVEGNVCAFGNKSSENADGIGSSNCKENTYRFNLLVGNNDDGLDMWTSTASLIEYNLATTNGDQKDGDGNGFKLGGRWKNACPERDIWLGGRHTVRHNLSFDNLSTGFTDNGSSENTYEVNVAFGNKNTGGYASVKHVKPDRAAPILAKLRQHYQGLFDAGLIRPNVNLLPPNFEQVWALGVWPERARLRAADMRDWAIVVAKNAISSERYAAGEFQRFFEKATGLALPVVDAPPKAAGNIFIGPGEAMRASSAGFSVEGMGDEDLRIRIAKDNIAIGGGRPRGTLYGVYEFAERRLGVRFLTFDHTHVPEAGDSLDFPCEDYSYHPPFSFRWSYYHENGAQPAFAARLRVNTVTNDEKLGGVTPQSLINHSFYRYLPAGTYGKEHPEYFAMVDGERKLDIGGGGPEPCVTNPDVIRIISEGVLADLRANPTRKNISVSQNDNDHYCRCERCEAINEREGTPMGANLHLVNAVADAVAKEFPDVKVGTLSYWYTRKPPKSMKPRENVQIQLCSIECCVVHPLDDPKIEKNRAFFEDLKAWGKICNDIWIWDYNTNFASYDLPFPNLRTISRNLRFFQRNNVHGVFLQANGNGNAGEFSDLRNYVMARCLWDPALDDWALTKEFCALHYQEAAAPILEYLAFIHEVAQQSGFEPNCFGTPEEFGLNAEVSRKAMQYFQDALERAESEAVKLRVEKASICAYRAMIETGSQLRYEDGKVRLVFPSPYEDTVEEYIALCAKHNMTHAAEGTPIAEYITSARQYTEGLSAARIENDAWRLTLLPEHNGKLIELRHKPSGRDLLATWPRAGLRQCGGAFEELGELGFGGGTFEAEVKNNMVTLTRTCDDGSTIVRTVTLPSDRVRFETTITHGGAEPKTYQVKIRPEYDVATTTKDHEVLAAYVLDGGTWRQFNQDWESYHGPNDALLRSAPGGGFAFFNHDAGFGMLERYDPQQFDPPRLWHNADRHQLNLELFSRRAELKPGQKLVYAYECAYLDAPLESTPATGQP